MYARAKTSERQDTLASLGGESFLEYDEGELVEVVRYDKHGLFWLVQKSDNSKGLVKAENFELTPCPQSGLGPMLSPEFEFMIQPLRKKSRQELLLHLTQKEVSHAGNPPTKKLPLSPSEKPEEPVEEESKKESSETVAESVQSRSLPLTPTLSPRSVVDESPKKRLPAVPKKLAKRRSASNPIMLRDAKKELADMMPGPELSPACYGFHSAEDMKEIETKPEHAASAGEIELEMKEEQKKCHSAGTKAFSSWRRSVLVKEIQKPTSAPSSQEGGTFSGRRRPVSSTSPLSSSSSAGTELHASMRHVSVIKSSKSCQGQVDVCHDAGIEESSGVMRRPKTLKVRRTRGRTIDLKLEDEDSLDVSSKPDSGKAIARKMIDDEDSE